MFTCDRCGAEIAKFMPREEGTYDVRMSVRQRQPSRLDEAAPLVAAGHLCKECAGAVHDIIARTIRDCMKGKLARERKPAGITLGQRVRDRVSGFEGTVAEITTRLYADSIACVVICDNITHRSHSCMWFNEGRLDVVEKAATE